MCLLGQGTARHIKFQGEVAAHSARSFDLELAPGPYRFRTVEAGDEADRDIGADGAIPTLVGRGGDILLEETSGRTSSRYATRATGRSASSSRTVIGPATR
jgi:hypothetical protein